MPASVINERFSVEDKGSVRRLAGRALCSCFFSIFVQKRDGKTLTFSLFIPLQLFPPYRCYWCYEIQQRKISIRYRNLLRLSLKNTRCY